ncbi:hypothetical protein MTO96_028958 [Rhipicephalus appendiculatus]
MHRSATRNEWAREGRSNDNRNNDSYCYRHDEDDSNGSKEIFFHCYEGVPRDQHFQRPIRHRPLFGSSVLWLVQGFFRSTPSRGSAFFRTADQSVQQQQLCEKGADAMASVKCLRDETRGAA